MNKAIGISNDTEAVKGSPALLHEMMRSFIALAGTLNLSQAVEVLGSTRQTVRRHISQLEESMQCKLFDVQQRRYALTEAGERALGPAQILVDQGAVWFRGQFDQVGGMMRFSYEDGKNLIYHQQQQPISRIWSGESVLQRNALKAWAAAEGQLEHPAMQSIRPYVIVYRDAIDTWICTEIGEESFYSKWFGWAQARSSIGRPLNQFPGGETFANLINIPFHDIQSGHGIRLDQVLTFMPNAVNGKRDMLAFDRLLMGISFPDGSPALMSVVDRPTKLNITGIDATVLDQMPQGTSIDFVS